MYDPSVETSGMEIPGNIEAKMNVSVLPFVGSLSEVGLFKRTGGIGEMKLKRMPSGIDINSQREWMGILITDLIWWQIEVLQIEGDGGKNFLFQSHPNTQHIVFVLGGVNQVAMH